MIMSNIINNMMSCNCGYQWTPRKASPKCCPMCKRYLVKIGIDIAKPNAEITLEKLIDGFDLSQPILLKNVTENEIIEQEVVPFDDI